MTPETGVGQALLKALLPVYPREPLEAAILGVEAAAAIAERERIIEVIANVPVTVRFTEPVTSIDVWQYHADIIAAIQRSSR